MEIIMNWLGTLPGAVAQGLAWGLMAIGVYITFKILDVADLTVDGSICTGMAVCAVLLTAGVNVWIAIICAMIAGMLAGLVTGLLHTLLGIPAILAGILTQLMLWSVNLLIMGGKANIALSRFKFADKVLVSSGESEIYKSLLVLLGFCAVVIGILYWFFGTELGMSLRSTGCNLEMSRAQVINTNFTKVFGLASDINFGRGAIVIGLAAVIIGEALFQRKTTNFALRLLFVVCGAIIYWLVFQTVVFIGLPTELLKMLSAIVVALFLGIPHLKKLVFNKKKKKGGVKNA